MVSVTLLCAVRPVVVSLAVAPSQLHAHHDMSPVCRRTRVDVTASLAKLRAACGVVIYSHNRLVPKRRKRAFTCPGS